MPNHITNVVTIKNVTPEQMNIIFPRIKEGEFSFNDVFPMPKQLEEDSCSYTKNEILLADFAVIETFNEDEQKEITKAKKLYDETGYVSWYAHNRTVYGTKWDAYAVQINNVSEVSEDSVEVEFQFQTAWSTPYTYFLSLSKKFPNLVIEVKYADEDLGANCGWYNLEDGSEDSYEYPMPVEPYYDDESVNFAGELIYGDSWESVKEEYRLSETE